MGNGLVITVSIGLVAAAVFLWFALRAGRDRPRRAWAWIAALVLLLISLAFRVAVMVGVSQGGGFGSAIPVAVGTAAVAVVMVASIWRPVWAGWFCLATAAAIPALLWLVQRAIAEPADLSIPAEALLATYSVPIAVIGVLLVVAGSTRATSTDAVVRGHHQAVRRTKARISTSSTMERP